MIEAAARPAGRCYETFLFGGIGERLAARFGTRGAPISLTTACATGASAIQLGVEAIQRGEARGRALRRRRGQRAAGGADPLLAALRPVHRATTSPTRASRPFEKTRDGFVMAEGAAALVLERLRGRRWRAAPRVLGLVLGLRRAGGQLPPHPLQPGWRRHHRRHAQRRSPMPGWRRATSPTSTRHGTGTPENDKMETLGMRAVFGETPPPISSNKSMIGHTLSAAGAMEAVFSLLTIRDQMLPPTINHDEPDPAIRSTWCRTRRGRRRVRHVLSNSFGFGGQNVCLRALRGAAGHDARPAPARRPRPAARRGAAAAAARARRGAAAHAAVGAEPHRRLGLARHGLRQAQAAV